MNFVTWLYADLGTIDNLRCIRTYGVNTYVWVNREGKRNYVKYYWIPLVGRRTIDRQTAVRLAGIELSNDKMLQGRSFIYWDAQRRRIGAEFRDIPVNHSENCEPGKLVTSGNSGCAKGVLQRSDILKPVELYQVPSPVQKFLIFGLAFTAFRVVY